MYDDKTDILTVRPIDEFDVCNRSNKMHKQRVLPNRAKL